MPLTSEADLAAFAAAATGTVDHTRPTYLKLSALLCWDAVIECALDAGAITRQRARHLRATDWREDFAGFVAPTDPLILDPAAMRAVPAGAFIAFIEVDQADAFHRSIAERDHVAPQGRRHIIHAMLSLGDGRAAGNKNASVGIGDPVGWQVLDLASSLNWRNDQPLDAVNAVPLGVNAARPIRLRWRALAPFQTPDVIEPGVAADLARLAALHEHATPGSILAQVLGDAIEASAQVREADDWSQPKLNVTNGGHATARYAEATGLATNYRIQYVWGNLGSLVHELTHVMNNQDYRRDFANHATAQPAAMPAPAYTGLGIRSNESDRQNAWRLAWDPATQARADDELRELSDLLQALDTQSELGQHKRLVADKLLYGRVSLNTDHDTVLNQILVWIHVDWQLAQAAHARAFVDALESACSRSREHRIAARSERPAG